MTTVTSDERRDVDAVDWTVDLSSWGALRALAYAKLVGVYGFLAFVISNVPLLVLAPPSGRLVSEPWRYVTLSAGASAALVAFGLIVYASGGERLLARVVDVAGTDDGTVFDSVGIAPVFGLVLLGAWLAAALVAHASSNLLGTAVVLVPVFVKLADALVSSLVPVSGTVDLSTGHYRIDDPQRSYDLASVAVLGAVETGGVTAFCVRTEDGVPHVLVLPTELYERVSKA